MIVNPPRSEVDLSPRLRAISVHALDKNKDPDDRPPRISRRVGRWLLILGGIFTCATCLRFGLWYFTEYTGFPSRNGSLSTMYRQMARDSEAEFHALQTMIKTGKATYVNRRLGSVTDPVLAGTLATQAEQLARFYRDQANLQDCLELGIPIR
jgi:hypothetical protein